MVRENFKKLTYTNMIERNEIQEIEIFKAFAKVCDLPFKLHTIKKKYPPEPDIKCDIVKSGSLAFELVQIMDQKFSNIYRKNKKTVEQLYIYCSNLPNKKKNDFEQLHSNSLISFDFQDNCTFRQREKLFPIIINHLLILDEQFEGYISDDFSKYKNKLKSIRITKNRGSKLRFRINHANFFTDPVLPIISSKFEKKYDSELPIHLLAFIDITPMIPEYNWLSSIKEFVKVSMHKSEFKKIWIYDFPSNRIKLVYP